MKATLALLLPALLGYAAATEVICYWGSWSHYRAGAGKVTVEDLDPHKCSIYIYSFATLNANTFKMEVFDPWLDIDLKGYEKFVSMKQQNQALKVLIAIGGWNDSQGSKYSTMLASPSLRAGFVSAAVDFLEEHGFDGLDLDYEYPTAADKPYFAAWVSELRTALQPRGLMLTAAVTASAYRIDQGYNVSAVSASLDIINVMTYDLHGSWEPNADHHAAFAPRASDAGSGKDVQSAMTAWMSRGAPASKLAMGVPLYGRTWTVTGTNKTPPTPGSGSGQQGTYTGEAGLLSYLEICENKNAGWTVVQDPNGKIGPYAYSGNQWVGYDDAAMVATKTQWAVSQGLAGVMVWDVSSEDVRNTCGDGSWPLMSAIQANLGSTSTTAATTAGTTAGSTAATTAGTTAGSTAATTAGTTAGSTAATTASTTASTTTAITAATTTSATVSSTAGTTPATTTTTSAPGGTFTCPSASGLFPDPADCQSYYNCGNGVPYHYTCPSGTLYDPNLMFCNWENQVSCSSGGTITTTTTTTTTAAPSGQFTCPAPYGWYADPADCHSYYNCFNGVPHHYTCPAGTSWQQSITNCNWSYLTGC